MHICSCLITKSFSGKVHVNVNVAWSPIISVNKLQNSSPGNQFAVLAFNKCLPRVSLRSVNCITLIVVRYVVKYITLLV
jgi:hypothetical protein